MKVSNSKSHIKIDKKSLADMFFLPGTIVCDWLNVKDEESRMLLRMFINLSVYGKISIILLLLIMGGGG